MPARQDPSLVHQVHQVRDAKNAKRQAEEWVGSSTAELLGSLAQLGKQSVTITTEGVSCTAKAVHGQIVTIDEAKLKKALGAAVFNKLTRPVLDKDLLEHAMAVGDVDPNVVAGCSESADRKPYIIINERVKSAPKPKAKMPKGRKGSSSVVRRVRKPSVAAHTPRGKR